MEAINISYLWLGAGVALFFVEAFGLPGVGMMFAGIGAFFVGTLLYLGIIDVSAHTAQFTYFFIITGLSAALLWKPLQQFRIGKRSPGYNNIVGETGYVGSNGISKTAGGEVTWSGTIMKAQLAHSVGVDKLEAGTPVVIVDISGSTLLVKPKEH